MICLNIPILALNICVKPSETNYILGSSLIFQKNIGLRKLDISWNGYGKDECFILSHALQENTTLKELDISNNRLNKEAIKHLLDGIQNGDGLETLRVRCVFFYILENTRILHVPFTSQD